MHSRLLGTAKGTVFSPLLWVGDWYRTLLAAALSMDSTVDRAAAETVLSPLLSQGPIDSVDQWAAITAATRDGPRQELLLAGIDVDRGVAAIRLGDLKLLVGSWGGDTWCDLNVSGFSPHYPVQPSQSSGTGPGGEGGLWCAPLPGTSTSAEVRRLGLTPTAAAPEPSGLRLGHVESSWWNVTRGLYNVSADPRELNDLQHVLPDDVARLRLRLLEWNRTTAPTIHKPGDPAGTTQANATDCWSPWQADDL